MGCVAQQLATILGMISGTRDLLVAVGQQKLENIFRFGTCINVGDDEWRQIRLREGIQDMNFKRVYTSLAHGPRCCDINGCRYFRVQFTSVTYRSVRHRFPVQIIVLLADRPEPTEYHSLCFIKGYFVELLRCLGCGEIQFRFNYQSIWVIEFSDLYSIPFLLEISTTFECISPWW